MNLVARVLTIGTVFTMILVAQETPPQLTKNSLKWEPVFTGVNASLRGICAVSPEVVWISGSQGTCVLTTDGGATWQDVSPPGADSLDFRDVEAFDEHTAVLLAAGEGDRSRIYRTTDGGKSWVLCYTNPFPKGFFCALAFWDRQRGLAFSDPVEGKFVVIRTTDGGNTWQQVSPVHLPPARKGEYGFAASGTCLTVQGTAHAWFGTGGSAARVFYSTDGGNSWQVANTPIVSGEASTGIFSLAFRDTLHGAAVGGDYRRLERTGAAVAMTTDGGRTWQAVEAPTVGYRSCVRYVPGTPSGMLVAVGRSGCSYSVDDGRRWQNFGGKAGFYTLSFEPITGAGWAAGSEGRVAVLKY